jgi:TonB family protein
MSKRKVLTMRFFGRVALLSGLAFVFSPVVVAQNVDGMSTPKGAILVNLKQPVYPPLARQANIYGEVIVTVTVHSDGKAGVALQSGHPMLAQAALDSAKQSQFECRGCSTPLPYMLVYTFKQTSEGNCCDGMGAPITVEQGPQAYDDRSLPQTRVTVSAEKICLCDPSFTTTKKVRSLKCLYLWKCSVRE